MTTSKAVSFATSDRPVRNPGQETIYLDYHATTPVDSRVVELMLQQLTEVFGNASSLDHEFGDRAANAVEIARKQVAELVDARSDEVFFTSGATESINVAMQGFVARFWRENDYIPKVAVSAVEHRAVLETARALAKANRIELVVIPVDREAQIRLDVLTSSTQKGLDLICVMSANNEVGTIYPVDEIGLLAESYGAAFLCDGAQSVGKVPMSSRESNITFLAISGHKMYGPKGVGAVVVRRRDSIDPILFGGGHERGLRPGTINGPGVAALGEACRLRSSEMHDDEPAIAQLRDRFAYDLLRRIDGLVVNGPKTGRLAGNLHVSIPDIPNGAIIARVRHEMAIATGAACTSGIEASSHVLQAMGLDRSVQEGALRFGLGKFTSSEDIKKAAELLECAVEEARKSMHRGPSLKTPRANAH